MLRMGAALQSIGRSLAQLEASSDSSIQELAGECASSWVDVHAIERITQLMESGGLDELLYWQKRETATV